MSGTAILIIGVGLVLTLPLAARVARRRFDPFEPIVVFGLAWGVMFVVRPAAILIRDDTDFYGVNIGPTLGRSVLLGLLGAVAFVVGYELRFGDLLATRVPAPRTAFDASSALVAAYITAALGLLALALVLLPTEGLHGVHVFLAGRGAELNELIERSTLYLWYGSLLVIPAALVAFAVAVAERTLVSAVSTVLLTGFALLRTVPTGNRIFLLVLFGGMLVFVFVHLSRRPGPLAVVLVLVVALVASYALLIFRDPDTRRALSPALRGLVHTPSSVVSPLVNGPDAEMAPALAGALQAVPSRLGYRFGGATIGDFFVRPIPRKLWHGKPQTPWLEATGAVWPNARATGNFEPAFTPLLSFYWDFGLLGAFVGMALLGVGARALYGYFGLHSGNLFVQLVFAAALCFLVVAVRHDPVSVTVWALVLFVPIVAISRFASRRGQRLPSG